VVSFVIIELEDGLSVAAVQAAAHEGGVLVDPGPFATYEEAYDALVELEGDDEEEQT
jgi:hypothetical protein